ncbi:glycoside hydrolase family 5 protein [Saprospiraceae bacterium]|nr:glycoside hydrolase family 5 protein [Saprospiraceae bacterium]
MNKLLILFLFFSICASCQETNLISEHGLLEVDGKLIVDKHSEPISVSGPSLFWGNNGWEGEKYYRESQVKYFREEWNATVIRTAMGVEVKGGYKDDPEGNMRKVEEVIDAAIKYDMYVIVDFHSHHAEDYQDLALKFFGDLAKKYGAYPNIMYEIYNEPLQVSWSEVLKPYSLAVIEEIRKHDPDNMVIVGTPNWSQFVDEAAKDPITEFGNIAYTFHFYAATHKEDLRIRARKAIDAGLPLFFTEWGTIEANGDGEIDKESVETWLAFMRENNISHLNWSICDKPEAASIFQPNIGMKESYSDSDLTASGKYVKSIIQSWNKDIKQ